MEQEVIGVLGKLLPWLPWTPNFLKANADAASSVCLSMF